MFAGPVGPVEVFFYWPEAIFRNIYWPGAISFLIASSPMGSDGITPFPPQSVLWPSTVASADDLHFYLSLI